MNEKGVEALVSAALSGRKQIRGRLADAEGGRCAMGVLLEAIGLPLGTVPTEAITVYALLGRYTWIPGSESAFQWFQCPGCPKKLTNEVWMITHLNDDHGWDFLQIARKLGPQ